MWEGQSSDNDTKKKDPRDEELLNMEIIFFRVPGTEREAGFKSKQGTLNTNVPTTIWVTQVALCRSPRVTGGGHYSYVGSWLLL